MHSSVIVARIDPGSTQQVAGAFAELDGEPSTDRQLLRRQLFEYRGVFIHLQDHTEENPAKLAELGGDEALATRFYEWHGQPVTDEHRMYSTVIVARLDPADLDTVAKLFGDFDSGTELPHTMGTRRRQLFAHDGLYFHIQDFESDNGGELIERAKQDPRFVRIQQDLLPYISVFDPATWRSPSDAMASRFYTWQVGV
ncbi:hypothetical protein M2283_007502 [Streptomyces pseudovenezuelae]|uniref:Polyketide synthase n=2 Tax=Streptomyces pseudovenezuelae TaxID=67350 RepID=A0ABT6LV23_9ACTN|nr:hypothetical protein [Streptomyces pseudovenezuelae]